MQQQQEGSKDCGIFSIAYAVDLAFGNDPAGIIYDQGEMRRHLAQCLQTKSITPFPRYKYTQKAPRVDGTSHIDATHKWSPPAGPSKKTPPRNNNDGLSTSNHFSPLSVNQDCANQQVDGPSLDGNSSTAETSLPGQQVPPSTPSTFHTSYAPPSSASSRAQPADLQKTPNSDAHSPPYTAGATVPTTTKQSTPRGSHSHSKRSRSLKNHNTEPIASRTHSPRIAETPEQQKIIGY